MKRSRRILWLLLLLVPGSLFAQNELDALRYSQIDVLGTARYAGMGGAFGALGGDMTTLSTNPGGIGVFNKTTSSVTLAVISNSTDTRYLGTDASNSHISLAISNVGFVARFKRKKAQDKQWNWKAFHLGLAYGQTANFNRRTSIAAINTNSSLIDTWVSALNNGGTDYTDIPTDPTPGGELTDSYLGWGAFLVDTVPETTASYLRNVIPHYGELQHVNETSKGSMGEFAVTFGGNFGNALYIGASVGIPTMKYELDRSYTESDPKDTIADFTSFTKTDYLKASGNGFNVKFGAIYRPVKWLRIGAAVHSPTFFEIQEEFSSVVVSSLKNTQYSLSTAPGVFKYSLRTPFRAIGSLAFVIGKIGLVSADYEYVNYTLAKFSSSDYGFNLENTNVKKNLHWAGNLRFGTEWRLAMISLRAGFTMNGNPYTGKYDFNDTRYSVGIGLRLKRFFADLTYQLRRNVAKYEVYDTALVPLANATVLDHSVMMTAGFHF